MTPYVALERPSVALGTLTACLAEVGIRARTVHANLLFAERIGIPAYEGINNSDITLQIGEWTFSRAAFPGADLDPEGYLANLGREISGRDSLASDLLQLQERATAFIGDLAQLVVEQRPRIVGCSSVFQQHCASLALLRRIRELEPEIVTMLGGANCEAAMGAATHRAYPWVDFVVSGEADRLLPTLCRRVLDEGRHLGRDDLPYGVFGPALRVEGAEPRPGSQRVIIRQLDDLPVPDYDDYFQQLERCTVGDHVLPAISLETSRGCWWGDKSHCTFCGLNGIGMTFRSKSAPRVLDEVEYLADRHGRNKFMVVDNILDNHYFQSVLPTLAQDGDKHFFYETKANLRRQQVELLSRSGVRWIQPGIEALSDPVLARLAKGTTVWQNVQLLKWARNYGVWVIWNHLYGAPGDEAAWYDEIADWLPLISHLQPPSNAGVSRIRIDRFSPYFDAADAYGLELEPYWSYRHVYPGDEAQLRRQVYFFMDRQGQTDLGTRSASTSPKRLTRAMREWALLFHRQRRGALPAMSASAPTLSVRDDGETSRVRDTRPCAVQPELVLSGLEAEVLRLLDTARGRPAVARRVRKANPQVTAAEIETAIAKLQELRLVAEFADRLLSLTLREPVVPYLDFADFPGLTLMTPIPDPGPPDPLADAWAIPVREVFRGAAERAETP
ncbi:MAG: RiPP maturation radical SAM C-methyltransferase [Holophagales bacterium]|nr:RiPP maturation radical SAM C-methyltransferase [Holophagales bacterium]